MISNRDISLDLMKAVAIFMVVLGHVIAISDAEHEVLRHIIYSVHMPIFFFVSGYLANKKIPDYRSVLLFLSKKARILIPFIVVGGGNYYLCHRSIKEYIFWSEKDGYWFLWTLFLMFIVYSLSNLLLFRNKKTWVEIMGLLLPVPFCLFLRKYESSDIGQLLNFLNMYNYLFFISGVILARYNLRKYILNEYIIFVSFIIYMVGLYSQLPVLNLPMKLCGVLFLFSIFSKVADTELSVNSRITSACLYIGRSSLGIYVLHYLIFRGIKPLPEPWHDYISSSLLFTLLIYTIVSLFVIALSILLFEMIKTSKYIRLAILGLL